MSDDQQALADELDQIAADHTRLAADAANLAIRVRRLGRLGDALDDFREGGLLTVREAAIVSAVSDQTIYDWIADAERLRRPIADKRATWVVGRDRLFAYIEKHRGGSSARASAEARLKEYWPHWSRPQEPCAIKRRAAG